MSWTWFWRRRRPDPPPSVPDNDVAEAVQTRHREEAALRDAKAQRPQVEQLAAALRYHSEVNHLAELIGDSFSRRRI